jgi:GT2 family glycosyltransferase
VSVVIVNYNQWEETARLVKQLLSDPATPPGGVEVVVVDNHSQPHPLIRQLRRWPGVSLRRWRLNQGFARAVNEGCRLSRAPWLLILNPDVSLEAGFAAALFALVDRLEREEPRTGIVGCALRNSDGSRQLSAGPFPTLPRTLTGLLKPRPCRKYSAVTTRQRCRVPWVTGCCLLLRQTCWRELGGWDADFFLYYEDVDLCRRAGERGWAVWYEPGLRAVHHHPLQSRSVSPVLRLVTRHALLAYGAKHWPAWQVRLLAGAVRAEAWLRRQWAAWRQQEGTAFVFEVLGKTACDLANARFRRARRRIVNLLSAKDEPSHAQSGLRTRYSVRAPVRRHSLS